MKLPGTHWQETEGMRHLLRTLSAEAGESRFVGGCVRDSLLGLPVNDVDIATRLAPQEVLDRLGTAKIKAVPTGLAHGTVTAVIGGKPVEVTTLRRDVATDGRHATIAYTDDWREDAARRDFTINAMSADPFTREIHDYFEGGRDLDARRVRFIGDPLQRIAEDHLRILRFFRFHARFGEGEPDSAGLEACSGRANDLMALSRERIADELLKILAITDPAMTVALMVHHGILRPVLPEIDGSGVQQLRMLISREQAAAVPPDTVRRLAALLPPDPQLAEGIASRLRLSKKLAKRLASAAGRSSDDARSTPETLAYLLGTEEAVDRLLLSDDEPEILRAEIARLREWQRPRFELRGGDLIGMGLSPGPLVARTLQALEREWVERGFPTPREVRELARTKVDHLLRDSQ